MTPGIFQHHGFVHHGELEMSRWVVDRNARIFGDRDDDQREQRQAQRYPQSDLREFM